MISNLLILPDTLLFVATLRGKLDEIWVLPINSFIWRYNDVKLRHCVDQVMPTIPDKTTSESFPHHVHFLRNKTISKRRLCGKKTPSPNINVASHKRPGIRLSFECTTTLLSGEGEEGRTSTATMFRKMPSKYTIFSTVLSKIVYKVIRVFSQEYLQGQNKNMLIKSTLQKLF